MGDSHSPSPEDHLLIAFPLAAHLVQRIRETLPFATVSYIPSTFVPGTKHPKALWSHEPPDVPAEIWARTTVLMTMFFVPTSRPQAPNLRYIQGMSAGLEHMLHEPFYTQTPSSELTVASASGVHSTNIAEYVLMQCLNAVHRQSVLRAIQAEKRWARTMYVPPGSLSGSPELRGDVLGILGYGTIGREVGRLASAFGMRVLAASSSGVKAAARGFTVQGTGDADGVFPKKWYSSNNPASLREFLEEVDILLVACPLTKVTKGLISETTIKYLKKSAYIVNIARGPVIDHEALYTALEEERIAGAILDVTDPEPLPAGHKLWTAKNCVITPHISGSGTMYETRCVDLLEINLKRLADGQDVLNKVDVGKGY
jgi:phosphoglycerate dehydrogenase-like enzyme